MSPIDIFNHTSGLLILFSHFEPVSNKIQAHKNKQAKTTGNHSE